jgi:hypothetical protein
MNANFERISMDLGKSKADKSWHNPPITAAVAALWVDARSQIARRRADFDRFSDKSEN